MEVPASGIWSSIERIRRESPVIHNITNYVVMNSTANALLALGASPVMAHAEEEVEDMVKLTVYLTDLVHFPRINEIMAGYFSRPYPARAAVGVAGLPRNAMVEIEAVMVLS